MNPKDFQSINTGKLIRAKTGYWAFLPAPLPPPLDWPMQLVNALTDAEHEQKN